MKDRIAWGMIRGDLGEITRRGQTLIEASSGNTAKALQVLAAMHGLRLRVLTNRAKVPEVRDMLELLGGDLEEMPGLSECPDPTVPNDVFSTIQALMAQHPGEFYHTAQYTNPANVRTHHDTTGREIADDLGAVDVLFGGLGTTGSTRGAATFLQVANPQLQTIGIVSTKEDFIPGIRSEAELWDVGLFEPAFYTEIIPVRAADAIDAALDLARQHGVLAGPTTGATYWAAQQYLRRCPRACWANRAERRHHRLRPAGALSVLHPAAPPGPVRPGPARDARRPDGRRGSRRPGDVTRRAGGAERRRRRCCAWTPGEAWPTGLGTCPAR